MTKPNSPYVLPFDVPFIKPSLTSATFNFQSDAPSILTFDTPKQKKKVARKKKKTKGEETKKKAEEKENKKRKRTIR